VQRYESIEDFERIQMKIKIYCFLVLCLSIGLLSLAGCTPKYKLSFASVPDNGGSVVSSLQVPEYNSGTRITVTAQPSPGWRFSRWHGDIERESGNKATIVVDKDKTVTAYFVKTYVLSLNVNPKGAGMLSADSGNYDSGTEVVITPQSFYGWSFDKWDGDVESASEQIVVKMDRDKKIIAQFVKDEVDQR
jgi:hypothetical protein